MIMATLCYLKRDGKTLMVHRTKKENDMHMGKWNGLGGKLEPGETPEECAIREVREESGLMVTEPILKGFLTFPGFANDEDWYAFLFVARNFKGELIDSPEGPLKWIDDRELLNLNLWEGDKIFLPWLEQPCFFSGKFVYVDGCLTEHEVIFYDQNPTVRQNPTVAV
jgi:8-oxo-dGTP diphosphatase